MVGTTRGVTTGATTAPFWLSAAEGGTQEKGERAARWALNGVSHSQTRPSAPQPVQLSPITHGVSGKAERCAGRVRRAPRTPIFSGSQTNAFADLRPTLRQFLTFRRKKTTTQSDTSEELIGRSASRPCLRPVPRTPAAAGPPSARAPHRSLSAAPAPAPHPPPPVTWPAWPRPLFINSPPAPRMRASPIHSQLRNSSARPGGARRSPPPPRAPPPSSPARSFPPAAAARGAGSVPGGARRPRSDSPGREAGSGGKGKRWAPWPLASLRVPAPPPPSAPRATVTRPKRGAVRTVPAPRRYGAE